MYNRARSSVVTKIYNYCCDLVTRVNTYCNAPWINENCSMRNASYPASVVRPHLPRLQTLAEHTAVAAWAKLTTQHGSKIGTMPTIKLSTRLKSCAGYAYCERGYIDLSAALLLEFPKEFCRTVIPHELIHFVDYRLHDNIGHGPTWKSLMVKFGIPADRCHNLMEMQISKREAGL